jgi:integrator complex subunit 7
MSFVDNGGRSTTSSSVEIIVASFERLLRSSSVGEQCSGVLLVSNALQSRETSPIIINTILLKLADLFRSTTNFIRFFIFKVLRECEQQQFAKILNIAEILRRISAVLQSNDPIARAITVR